MKKTCVFLILIKVIIFVFLSGFSTNAQKKLFLEYRNKGFGLLNKSYFLNDSKITKDSVAKIFERENLESYSMLKKPEII